MNRNKYVMFTAIGFELVGLVLVGLFIGQSIDATYKYEGLATTFGILVALLIWIVHVLVMAKTFNQE